MAGRFYSAASVSADKKSGLGRGLLGSSPSSPTRLIDSTGDILSSRVFVANVPVDSVQRMQLHSRFSKYGIVTEVLIHRKGFAFIQFKNRADAVAAIIGESGTYLEGRRITCEITKTQNRVGPSRNPTTSKELVIGDHGNRDNKPNPKSNQRPSFGNLKPNDAPLLPTDGGGDAQTLQKDGDTGWGSEPDWGAESLPSAPPPPPPPSSTKQDHSLTLGLFMKKSKKPPKLSPFKKAGRKAETVNQGDGDESKPPPSSGNLKLSVFSNFKFGNDLIDSATPEAGPFEELWDSEFVEQLEAELCAEEGNDPQDDYHTGNKVANNTNDEIWEEKVGTSAHHGEATCRSSILSRKQIEVTVPTVPEITQDNRSDPSWIATDESAWGEDSPKDTERPVNCKAPVSTQDHHHVKVPVVINDTSGAPCKMNPNDAENWDEEIDVVGTPSTSPRDLLPVGINRDHIKNEPIWGEEPGEQVSIGHQNARSENNSDKKQDSGPQERVSFLQESSVSNQSVKPEGESNLMKSDEKPSVQMPRPNQLKSTSPVKISHTNIPPVNHSSKAPSVTNNSNVALWSQLSTDGQARSMLTAPQSVGVPSSHQGSSSHDVASQNRKRQWIDTSMSTGPSDHTKPSSANASLHQDKGPVIPVQNRQQPAQGMLQLSYPMSVNAPPVAVVPVVVPVQIQPRFGRQEPPMAANYAVPYAPPGQTPPPPQEMQPPLYTPPGPSPPPQQMQAPGPPPTPPPPTPPPMVTQQVYPVGMNPQIRTSQNITYGSLYPSRPVGGSVGGYMAYNVSMSGQPMYQHGQQVGMNQQGRQMTPATPPSAASPSAGGQMMQGNPNEHRRQRQFSGPSGFASVPPSPSHDVNDQRVRHMSGPSPNTTPPPPLLGQQQQMVMQQPPMQMAQSGNQPPMQMAQSGNQPPMQVAQSAINQPPMQIPGSSNQQAPTSGLFTYQQQGQMVSRMSTNYLSSSGPYGTGMKNLSMSASSSSPLNQQLGYRDSSFPLTDMEKSKINSEFREALETAGGALEVTDNTLLRIFMVLPEPIRRGIKRTGGLKSYLQQCGAFEVKGDMVSLPGQMKKTGVGIQPPPGSYHGRKSSYLSSNATEFVPGEQRSRSSSSSSTSSRGQTQGDSWSEKTWSSSGSVRSRLNSAPDSSQKKPATFAAKTRRASVSDNVKDEALAKAAESKTGEEEEDKKDEAVYKLIKDEPVSDDLWELDSFLTEAYGGGYYKDYLALSKELEKKTSEEAKKPSTSQDKAQAGLSRNSTKPEQETSDNEVKTSSEHSSSQDTSTSTKSSASTRKEPVTTQGRAEELATEVTQQKQESGGLTATQDVTKENIDDRSVSQMAKEGDEVECQKAGVTENPCKAQVIDPGIFARKTSLTFAAKLLEAASMHSESTSERTDGSTPSVEDVPGECDIAEELEEEWGTVKACEDDTIARDNSENVPSCSEIKDGAKIDGEVIVDLEEELDGSGFKIDKDEDLDSVGSWGTVSNDSQGSPQRQNSKQDLVDQFLAKEVIDVLSEMTKASKKKSSTPIKDKEVIDVLSEITKASKKKSSKPTKSVTTDDIAAAMPSSDSEVVKTKRNKVKCAAVFSTSDDEIISRQPPGNSNAEAVEKDPETEVWEDSEEVESLEGKSLGETQEGEIQELEVLEAGKPKETQEEVVDNKEDLLTESGDGESLATDTSEPNGRQDYQKSTSDGVSDANSVSQKPLNFSQKSAEVFSKSIIEKIDNYIDSNTARHSDDCQVEEKLDVTHESNNDTEQISEVAKDISDKTSNETELPVESAHADRMASSVQKTPQSAENCEIGATSESSVSSKLRESHIDNQNPVQEEIIVQSHVPKTSTGNYLKGMVDPRKEAQLTKQSVSVNTDIVKTVNKGIVTRKVAKMSRVTNTTTVNTVARGVMTTEEYEEAYRQKNMELETQIRLLEESLTDERDKMTLQKHAYQVETRTLKDSLDALTTKKNEIEDQLKIKKRQQVVEIRKTSAELRDTDARYSAQKSKVNALEKENACIANKLGAITQYLELFESQDSLIADPVRRTNSIETTTSENNIITRELSAVTRELFNLQATMEADTSRRRRTISIDETTSTEDLQEVQQKEQNRKEERSRAMYARAQSAELKILKMHLENCQQALYKIQEQGQYTYSVYANSPQISVHEKLRVNSQWSMYQTQVQEAIQKLLVDYERNETLLKEGAPLAELTPLLVPRLETFTPNTMGPSSMRATPNLLSGLPTEGTSLGSDDPLSSSNSSPSSRINTAGPTENISDASLDELKSMTSKLLQPDLDLSKPLPNLTGSVSSEPNLAGSAPLFSMGSLYGQQQSGNLHHPYTRQTREERLRSIQRRLGLNPDTGKPIASRTPTPSSAASLGAALGASGAAGIGAAAIQASKNAAPSLLGSNAFSFAMKQRSLASTYRSARQRHLSSSSDDSSTKMPSAIPHHPPASTDVISHPPPATVDVGAGALPRGRSFSSPAQSVISQPEMAGGYPVRHASTGQTQQEYPAYDSRAMETSSESAHQAHNEPINFGGYQGTTKPSLDHQDQAARHIEPKGHHQDSVKTPTVHMEPMSAQASSHHSTVYVTPAEDESELQANRRTASDPYQQQVGSQQLYHPPPTQRSQQHQQSYQQQEQANSQQVYQQPEQAHQQPQPYQQPQQASQQQQVYQQQASSQQQERQQAYREESRQLSGEKTGDDGVEDSWENLIIEQENQSHSPPEDNTTKHIVSPPQTTRYEEIPPPEIRTSKPQMQPPQKTRHEETPQPVRRDSHSSTDPHSSQKPVNKSQRPATAPVRGPYSNVSPVKITQEPQFPKSEAIKAARSASPVEQLEESWINLPARLKERVVPHMTRSGGVTLKPLVKSQEAPSVAGGNKRKGGKAWSGVGALAPIDDVEGDGWTTVIGKKKKKTLDIVEQQQQQQHEPPSAPKPTAKSSGSLDKIHTALARQFPSITRKEVADTMIQIRISHSGSLSGVSMAVLVKEASSHIKNTNAKYMVAKSRQHSSKDMCKLYGCEGFCKLNEVCDDICVICQDDLRAPPGGSTRRGRSDQNQSAKVRMLDCGHVFHDECINVWYNTRERTCPICRCHTLLEDDFPALTKDDFPALIPS